MSDDVPIFKQKVKIGKEEIILDPAEMKFTEATLNEYMEKEALWYSYFGGKLADAELILQYLDLQYDAVYSERYKEHKENGCTERLAEAHAKRDPDVEKAKKAVVEAKHATTCIKNHIRAWDRAHANAQSRGHMLRREMDKLSTDIYEQSRTSLQDEVESIVGGGS